MSVYLDHNATTPVRPEAAEAVRRALADVGNPSSVHGEGRRARRRVEDARDRVADLVGGRPDDVIFTSGGTEASNQALADAAVALVSAVEHVSVIDAAPQATCIPVDADGVVDLEALDTMLRAAKDAAAGSVVVSVMLANNETGVIQPVRAVADLARRHGAIVHCDAVQALGKMPVDLTELGVHRLSLSAHKIGGPQGVGALVVAPGHRVAATLRGGGQERSRRGGTENVPGIAGFGRAAELLANGQERMPLLRDLRDALEDEITRTAPDAVVFARGRDRLANTSCIAMPGVTSETQVMAFDLDGIAVSAGSACSSGKVESSHVLKAMGVAEDQLNAAVRVSLGWTTEAADTRRFCDAWKALHARLGGGSLAA